MMRVHARDAVCNTITGGLWTYIVNAIGTPVSIAVYNRVGAQVQSPIWEKAP